MDQVYRLTFNKPSSRAFFEGMTGVRVALEGRTVKFKPVTTFRQHSDAVAIALSERGDRGGYEAEIEGNKGAELLKALQRLSTPRQPFFLLRKEPDGWLALNHYAKDNNPPKFEPHVRFWPPRDEETPRQRRARLRREMKSQQAATVMPKDPALAFSKKILEAHKVLSQYHSARRIGRPPREVVEAQTIMDAFSTLVRKVRPSLTLEEAVDMRLLEQVHEHLGALIATTKQPAVVEDETPKRVAAPKPVAATPTPKPKPVAATPKPARSTAKVKAPVRKAAGSRRVAESKFHDTTYVRDEHAQDAFEDLTPEEQAARLAEEAQRRMGIKPKARIRQREVETV